MDKFLRADELTTQSEWKVEGLNRCKRRLEGWQITNQCIILLRLAELVLTLNRFLFGDNCLNLTNGVAMGNKMRPGYANLFVGFIEHQFFSQYNSPKPELYGRYIYDCMGATSSILPERSSLNF